MDEIFEVGAGKQAVQGPSIGRVGDQQNAAAIPLGGQIGEEVVCGGQNIAVALAAGEGLVDVAASQRGENCLRAAVEAPVVAFTQAGILVDRQRGARESDPRGGHGAVQVGGEHRRDAVVTPTVAEVPGLAVAGR